MNIVNGLDFFITHFGHHCVEEDRLDELRELIQRFVNDHPDDVSFVQLTDVEEFYKSCFWITHLSGFVEDNLDAPNSRDNYMLIVALAKVLGAEGIFETAHLVSSYNLILKLESVITGEYITE